MGQDAERSPAGQQYNAALRPLLGPDLRVLFVLVLLGALGLGLLATLRGDDRGPDPDRVAACEAWGDVREVLEAEALTDEERLARLRAVDGIMRTSGPEPRTFAAAQRELEQGGDHFDNDARRLDERCDELLR